jgi:hypothetical protein
MLTLTQSQDIAKCKVCKDDVDPLTFYVVPFTPRIALDDKGKPMISLVWYRRDVSKLSDEERKTKLGGGILTASAELSTTPEQEKAIREKLANDPDLQARLSRNEGGHSAWWNNEIKRDPKKLAQALRLGMIPVKDGTVQIAILAETPDAKGEFVGTIVGAGRVSMMGNMRASFMAKLTQDGVVLLWNMLEKNLLGTIRIGYDLVFDHRLNAVNMVVWCDAEKSYKAVREMWATLKDDARFSTRTSGNNTTMSFSHDTSDNAGDRLRSAAEANQASFVHIDFEDKQSSNADAMMALQKAGNDMISQFLAGTILDYKPGADVKFKDAPDLKTELPSYGDKKYGHDGIQYYDLKDWKESMKATLNSHMTTKAVLEGHLGPNDNLSNILQGQRVDDFRAQIDINAAWFQYLDVQVVCTANFEEDPVDLVEAHLSYQARGNQGDINRKQDFIFKKDSPPGRFSTYLAGPDQKSYDYTYTVYYKGTNQKMVAKGKTEDTVCVLDADRMGILRVLVEVGLIDWNQVKTAFVKMKYGSGSNLKETEFTLSQQQPKQTWNEVIAAEVNEPYRYTVTFVDQENRNIVMPEATSTTKHLIINQPLQQNLSVAVIPAGEFGADGLISRIAVALRYRDEGNNYNLDTIVMLDDAKKSQIWRVPLMNPKLRSYEYQTTVFYSDGVTRVDEWSPTDSEVLAVGDPYGFRVQITPRLLMKSPYSFGTIHLSFNDGTAGIHAEKTMELNDFAKPLFWRFRLGSPTQHTYKYQLTLYKDDGTENKLPETEADQDVLVLRQTQ